MLNVGALREGFVLDHIKAGKAMTIYHDLKLDKLDCTVAIIKNARSQKMGKKDIIKVECPIEDLDLDILGFIDHNILAALLPSSRDWIRFLFLLMRKRKFTGVSIAKRSIAVNGINNK